MSETATKCFTAVAGSHVEKSKTFMLLVVSCRAGLPDENFNTKPSSAKKRQKQLFKSQKKAKLFSVLQYSFVTKKHSNYTNIIRNFLRN